MSGAELIIVLLVAVVVFGPTQLPRLARSLGQAQREFRRGLTERSADDDPAGPHRS